MAIEREASARALRISGVEIKNTFADRLEPDMGRMTSRERKKRIESKARLVVAY
jgi:hypothetical protein